MQPKAQRNMHGGKLDLQSQESPWRCKDWPFAGAQCKGRCGTAFTKSQQLLRIPIFHPLASRNEFLEGEFKPLVSRSHGLISSGVQGSLS